MIGIIDYGLGNILSFKNVYERLNIKTKIIKKKEDFYGVTKIILPGVGAFDHGMHSLRALNLIDVLNQKVLVEKTPILGICLGVQLFTKRSDEGTLTGLGWIDAETVQFDKAALTVNERVPHMGWRDVELNQPSRLAEDLPTDSRFYFVHSYHLRCHSPSDVLFSASYGYSFPSGIEKENIYGVQFHPEKSHRFGKKLLANYAALN